MSSDYSPLSHKSLIIVFAYAPAGLGHLRVTDALYHGLPKEVTPILLGSQDKWIAIIHRVCSIHPVARAIFEWVQNGWPAKIFTALYRSILRSNTQTTYEQITTIIDQRIELPKTVLVVATHFGLAHQLAAIKEKIIKEKNVNVILVVQVTDDTPQPIWYVPGADLIFVPSKITKEKLTQYGKSSHLPKTPIAVNPYPISPTFCKNLLDFAYEERHHQVNPESKSTIRVSLPISRAAVGTNFTTKIIEELHKKSPRFVFYVVAKKAPFTQKFLITISHRSFVNLYISTDDRAVVDQYDQMYHSNVISLEITKPSEQAFKVLLKPTQRGGVIMFFASPVGRQEIDNMDFLRRHFLIPKLDEQEMLWKKLEDDILLTKENKQILFEKAKNWRGLVLPDDAKKAANFICWCLGVGILNVMIHNQPHNVNHHDENCGEEIKSTGVHDFWIKVANLINRPPNRRAVEILKLIYVI